MNQKCLLIIGTALCSLLATTNPLFAQGTAITYQGRLFDAGNPASGKYDLRFNVYDSAVGGVLVAGPLTNAPVTVTNGLFVVTLDFGAGAFTGPARWLDIGARSNGVAVAYTTLTPRQQLTPTPYAITAENVDGAVSAGQLTGTLPAGLLSGPYGNPVTLNNSGNTLAGDGGGLTGLNASQLTSGTVSDLRLSPNVALLNRSQTFTATDIFASGGGAGRLIVSNSYIAVDTNVFTGLSLQYDAGYGEGALMSSYNSGEAYLSFYTKAAGVAISRQMTLDFYGTLAIDQGNHNNGFLNNNNFTGAGLTFGGSGSGPGGGPGNTSGEGIASKRTAGGNQNGLDFYTSFSNRLSILNNGFVGIGRQTQVSGAELFGLYSPATNSWGGMYIQGASTSRPFYGYSNPSGTAWTEMDGTDGNKWKLYNNGYQMTVTPSGSVGIGTTSPSAAALEVANGDVRIDNHELFLTTTSSTNSGSGIGYRTGMPGISSDGPFIYGFNGGALGGLGPTTIALSWSWSGNVWVSNNLSTATLTIRGGADVAEPFNITSENGEIPQGAVVVIDERNPGHLKLSNRPYDTRVAGVVSGANGINPGIQMQQQGLLEGGKNVALTGRVYVQATAMNGAINPGDMLTTSSLPGYAMKVTNHSKGQGAILGKAMTGLSETKGMVLVLVTLQ